MIFSSLEEKCRYYQSLSDYKLMPNSYVLCHLDGRAFSKNIKDKFELPFSDDFIGLMNETARYLCKEVQGCVLAYIQSDEITLVLKDFTDTVPGDGFFGYRLCKMQSILASMATSRFNKLYLEYSVKKELEKSPNLTGAEVLERIHETDIFQFDCKCWSVPSYDDAFAWILYRQIDCIRNSKQQAAQVWCTYEELLRKNTDEQIELLRKKTGIDWNSYSEDKKYGRFLKKTTIEMSRGFDTYFRSHWDIIHGKPLTDEENRAEFKSEFFLRNI